MNTMPFLLLHHPLTLAEVVTAAAPDRLRVPEELGTPVLSAGHTLLRAERGACPALVVTERHLLTNTDKPHALQILLQACF